MRQMQQAYEGLLMLQVKQHMSDSDWKIFAKEVFEASRNKSVFQTGQINPMINSSRQVRFWNENNIYFLTSNDYI